MIGINEKKTNCCGCSACAQACPQGCIVMEDDAEGFTYPKTDRDKCIDCGLCEKVCPVISKGQPEEHEGYPRALGGWHKNPDVRADSSSGGAFSLFAEAILEQGGVVYGCTLDENMRALHICVDSVKDLYKLRGSKYVQSSLEGVYSDVKKHLDSGVTVLFSGSPCQAAGLNTYLGDRKYEHLYVIDFICHGVPSPAVFAEYIENMQKKYGSRITGYRFRLKDHGWKPSGLQLGTLAEMSDGTKVRKYPAFKDSFMNGFLDDAYLRPICYECPFKEISRNYSDYTIADFWGVDKVNERLNDGMGTSLLLIHDSHAGELWDRVKGEFSYEDVDLTSALKRNRSIDHSVVRNKRRDTFFDDLVKRGYSYTERKYMSAVTWAWHRAWKLFGRFEQFAKFALVGFSNTFISLAVYYICIFLGVHYLIAYTMGFLLSVCNAFFWNNGYVFVNKQETSTVKAFGKVFMSYGFSFVLSLVLMGLLVDVINVPEVIAPLLKMAVTVPINFVLNKLWAFKDRRV